MAITTYVDFVNNYLVKNGMIGNATNINKAPDQLKLELDEINLDNSAANILVKLKTVDGAGSGLDADLLDGMNATNANTATTVVSRDASGNFSAGIITAALSGNANTATKLQTARTINGVAFDGSANITVSDSTKAPLNGSGTSGTWGISVTGNAATATNVSGGRAVVYGTGNDYCLGGIEVLGNGLTNTVFPTIGFHQEGLYASSLQLRGGGDFRFYTQGANSYANVTANTFIGSLSGNAGTATTLSTDRNNFRGSTESAVVGELMWKNYGNGHTIFDASNSTTPTGVAKNNANPDVPWSPTAPTLMGYNGVNTCGVRVDSSRYADQLKTARTINGVAFDGTANITISDSTWVANDTRAKTALNASGSAPIYACRAWVNFNSAGTVAIRASGNVSSITDNGVGEYTVNFTTAMPDTNYSIVGIASATGYTGASSPLILAEDLIASNTYMLKTTSAIAVITINNDNDTAYDAFSANVSIFR